jgi:hypothetical protein
METGEEGEASPPPLLPEEKGPGDEGAGVAVGMVVVARRGRAVGGLG